MITILHRGGPPKWLQYYIGVVWQMITAYHEFWVFTLGISFPKNWQKNLQGVSKKTSFCQNWPWQILLLTVRNPYETFANTSKTPSPSLTTSKCASTCDEFFPNCFVVFQARCCILLPKIVIPEQRCLQGRNSVSLSDPFLQWSSTGGGVPRTFCLGSWQIFLWKSCH